MNAYLARRVVATVPVLFGVSLLVFSMLALVPGDPVQLMLSEFQTTPEQIARLRSQLHLDEPLPVQFGRFVWNAVRGDLGTSFRSGEPVGSILLRTLPITLELTFLAVIVATVTAIPVVGASGWTFSTF